MPQDSSERFVFHEVRPDDLDNLESLAGQLDTLNLPDDRQRLEKIIHKSRISFSGQRDDISDREYVIVLRDLQADRLVGASMIIAQHGSYKRPSVYFEVRPEQKYSDTLDKFFEHEVLQLRFDYHGPTEIGGLILHPDYRKHRLKLGTLISYVRFLYIGMHQRLFRDRIVAELLPPLRDDGSSALWDCLGNNFTELDYRKADKLSRENVEFIRSLFPSTPIYTALLPKEVRSKIGVVGQKTKPAERLLRRIGFEYEHRIDPFDGGPTFGVQTDRCKLVRRTEWLDYIDTLEADEQAGGLALIGFEHDDHDVRFRATLCGYQWRQDGLRLRAQTLDNLRADPGQSVGFLPLTGPALDSVYERRER
jgi:arginine N-succinyltransferase